MIKVIPNNLHINDFINLFFIGFAFSIPISKALTSLFGILIIITWIIEGNISQKIKTISKDTLSLLFLFLILFSIFSLLWSPDVIYGIKFIQKYWQFLIIPIMLTSFNSNYTKYVLNAFLLSMLISEITSYGIYFELWTYKNVLPSDPSPFMNHIEYSIYLAMTIIIIVTKLLKEKSNTWKVFLSLYLLTALINLFINGGRTGQVSFLIAFSAVTLIYFKLSIKYVIGLFIILGSILVIAYNFSPNFQHRVLVGKNDIVKMQENNDYTGSISARIGLLQTGIAIFIDNPGGTGIGGEMLQRDEYSQKLGFGSFERFSDYHNSFLMYAVQLGMIGLLTIILIFCKMFFLQFTTRSYKALSIGFILIFFTHSMGGFTFHLFNAISLLVLFTSLLNSLSHLEHKSYH